MPARPERLKFGVIGRAVNEVARAEDMSKALKHPVIVTDAVASRVAALDGQAGTLTNLGLHDLRGIPTARRLWALRSAELRDHAVGGDYSMSRCRGAPASASSMRRTRTVATPSLIMSSRSAAAWTDR